MLLTWGKKFAYNSDVTEMLLLLWVVQGHVPRALHTILRGSLYVCVLLKKQLLAGAPGLISSTSTHRDYREEIPENQKKEPARS